MQFACACGNHYNPDKWIDNLCPKCGKRFLDPFRGLRRLYKKAVINIQKSKFL